jgi:hypothetical protein
MGREQLGRKFSFERYKDLISGAALILLGIYIALESGNIKGHAQSNIVNAQLIPRIIGITLIVISGITFIKALVKLLLYRKTERNTPAKQRDDRITLGCTAALLILYALMFRPLGFIVSSMIYLFLQVLVLTPGEKRTRRVLPIAAAVSVIVTVLVYIGFRYGLEILLPVGILG